MAKLNDKQKEIARLKFVLSRQVNEQIMVGSASPDVEVKLTLTLEQINLINHYLHEQMCAEGEVEYVLEHNEENC